MTEKQTNRLTAFTFGWKKMAALYADMRGRT